MSVGATKRLVGEACDESRWIAVDPEVGMWYSWTGEYRLGGRRVPGPHAFPRRLSLEAAQVHVRATPIPPQRLSVRHHQPPHVLRGRSMGTEHHHQANAAWDLRFFGPSRPQQSCPNRGLPSVRERSRRVRQKGAHRGQEEPPCNCIALPCPKPFPA